MCKTKICLKEYAGKGIGCHAGSQDDSNFTPEVNLLHAGDEAHK